MLLDQDKIHESLHRMFREADEALRQSGPRIDPEAYNVRSPRMAKPSSYKKGGRVRKSGLALVHKGEKIVSRRAATILSKGKRRSKKARKKKPVY